MPWMWAGRSKMLAFENAPGTFFDGQTSAKRTVTLSAASDGVAIIDESGQVLEAWPFSKVRRVRDTGSRNASVFYLLGDEREARLTISRIEDVVALKQLAPNLDQRPSAQGSVGKMLFWGGGAIAAVVLMIFVIIPGLANQMAVLIPVEKEEAVGRVALGQIERVLSFGEDKDDDGNWTCSSPKGDAALQVMTKAMLGSYEMPYDLKVSVVDHPMINAFALPGGHIVLMRGLLDKAGSAEEVAGVLAHELGHVAARDPIRLTLRAGGSAGILSLLLGDATGGTAIALAGDQILNASNTRAAETNADIFALERLAEANVSPDAFANFFETLRKEYGDTPKSLELFASHPNLASRAMAARNMGVTSGGAKVLNDAQWAALQSICGEGS